MTMSEGGGGGGGATAQPPPPLCDEFGFAVPEDLEALHLAHAERFLQEELQRTERWERFVASASPAASASGSPASLEDALLAVLPKKPIRARRLWCDDDGEDEAEDDRRAVEDDDEDDFEEEEEDGDKESAEGGGGSVGERRRQRREARRRARRRARRELDRLILGGVPNALRGRVWPLLLRARERFPPEYYTQLLALVAEAEKEEGQEEEENGEASLPPPNDEDEAAAAATAPSSSSSCPPNTISPSQRAAWLRVGPSVLAQIDKDVPRTFPRQHQHQKHNAAAAAAAARDDDDAAAPPSFSSSPLSTARGRAALRRVLAAYSAHRPAHGYAQGMNMWAAGLMLRISDESLAFSCLAALAEDVVPGYFCPAMVAPRADQRLLGRSLLPERLPHVSAALRRLFGSTSAGDAAAAAALPGWLLSGFVGALPFAACARCWDLFFYERTAAAPLRVALALLERGGRALEAVAAGAEGAGGGGGDGGGGGGGLGGGGDCADAAQLLLQLLPASAIDGGALVRAACSGRFCDLTGARVEGLQHAARKKLLEEEKEREAERARRLLGMVGGGGGGGVVGGGGQGAEAEGGGAATTTGGRAPEAPPPQDAPKGEKTIETATV